MSFDLKTTTQPAPELSPQLKKLNGLIDQIEEQKLNLKSWQAAQSEIQHYAGQNLVPVYQDYHRVMFQQLEHLWNSLSQMQFSRADLRQVDEKIQTLAMGLKSNRLLTNAQLEHVDQIITYYQQQAEFEDLKNPQGSKRQETSQALDAKEIDEIDAQSNVQGGGEAEQEWNWEHDWEENVDRDQYQQAREQAKLKRKQDKQTQAEKMSGQSFKSVYLKIASIIHPDREPDESKKAEKTELLQRANEAYEQQDLFNLLKLQLEVEQQRLNKKALSDEQLKFYQMALESQSTKLKNQIEALIDGLVWSRKAKIAVQKAKGQLNIKDLYKQIDADVSAIKHQLKAEKQRLMYMRKESGLEMLLEHQVL